jgi:hypothetical protein
MDGSMDGWIDGGHFAANQNRVLCALKTNILVLLCKPVRTVEAKTIIPKHDTAAK